VAVRGQPSKLGTMPDARALELARMGIEGFFWDHAKNGLTCLCDPTPGGKADPECDVGWSLYRLSEKAKAGKLDDHAG
jgi:hypothetical protein